MDIKKIRSIVNSNDGIISDAEKRGLIIAVISEDEMAIPDILDILNSERHRKKSLISEFNKLLIKS